jgi:CPA2 family monovalent cation:H+ antiporter-2
VDYARVTNPRLDIVVRTHSPSEASHMRQRGVAEAVVGEHELALEMTRHTLHRYGLSNLEILAITRGLRDRLADQAEGSGSA